VAKSLRRRLTQRRKEAERSTANNTKTIRAERWGASICSCMEEGLNHGCTRMNTDKGAKKQTAENTKEVVRELRELPPITLVVTGVDCGSNFCRVLVGVK
jgi:hypothetical protein